MNPVGLFLLALGWSGAVWTGAALICRLQPAPRAAQTTWRVAAALMFAPFLAALVAPSLPALSDAPLPEVPVLEPLFVQPDMAGLVAEASPIRLPELGVLITALVAAGWAVRFALWLISQVRLQRLKARALRVDRPVRHWADAMDLARVPDVRLIPRGAPFLAGILHPCVFVPAALMARDDAPQVIVHEMVHLKRGDLITRPLERLVADLFWFSPFAWAIRERLDYWREVAVDEAAADLTGDRIAYARALTRAARLARPGAVLPVAALVLTKEGNLKMRLTELLNEAPRRPRRLGLAAAAALALAAPLAFAQGMLIKGGAAPLASPVNYSHPVLDTARLTSTFGTRKHPITGEQKLHGGVDLAEKEGRPVYAPTTGTVTRAEYDKGYGNLVEIIAGDTTLRFGQLETMKVKAGDTVTPGETIATLGQSGQATGPHLHFEVIRGGERIDPQAEEGLVLAETLRVPASAPAAPVAKTPAAPNFAPTPPAPRALAPEAPSVPPAPAAVPAAAPAAMPAACREAMEWEKTAPRAAAWNARLDAARESNKQAGLGLKTDWIPKAVAYPKPVYPAPALQSGASAACRVMFDLSAQGFPTNTIAECSDDAFEMSAAEFPGAQFKPVTDADGKAVEVKGVVYPLQYCIE